MFDFKKCHPIELDDLVRIGQKYDGGYILSQKQIENTETVLSFGINLDWSFEEAFFSSKKVKIYSYDYSTKEQFEKNIFGILYSFFYSIAAIMYCLIRLRPDRAKLYLRRPCLKSNFYRFFNEEQGKYYIPKYIGTNDNNTYTCFETIFNELGNINELTVFIKMDIEGAEYDALPQLMRYLDKVNGIAVEFHDITNHENEITKLLDELMNEFYIAHVHGCNFDRLIENTAIPNTLEITLINKKLVKGEIKLSKKSYPIKGFDFPDNAFRKDYILEFK